MDHAFGDVDTLFVVGVVARISGWCRGVGWDRTATLVLIWDSTMPFKANAARRHHIPKQKRKVTNWAAYDASLRQRGSLTVWFTDESMQTRGVHYATAAAVA